MSDAPIRAAWPSSAAGPFNWQRSFHRSIEVEVCAAGRDTMQASQPCRVVPVMVAASGEPCITSYAPPASFYRSSGSRRTYSASGFLLLPADASGCIDDACMAWQAGSVHHATCAAGPPSATNAALGGDMGKPRLSPGFASSLASDRAVGHGLGNDSGNAACVQALLVAPLTLLWHFLTPHGHARFHDLQPDQGMLQPGTACHAVVTLNEGSSRQHRQAVHSYGGGGVQQRWAEAMPGSDRHAGKCMPSSEQGFSTQPANNPRVDTIQHHAGGRPGGGNSGSGSSWEAVQVNSSCSGPGLQQRLHILPAQLLGSFTCTAAAAALQGAVHTLGTGVRRQDGGSGGWQLGWALAAQVQQQHDDEQQQQRRQQRPQNMSHGAAQAPSRQQGQQQREQKPVDDQVLLSDPDCKRFGQSSKPSEPSEHQAGGIAPHRQQPLPAFKSAGGAASAQAHAQPLALPPAGAHASFALLGVRIPCHLMPLLAASAATTTLAPTFSNATRTDASPGNTASTTAPMHGGSSYTGAGNNATPSAAPVGTPRVWPGHPAKPCLTMAHPAADCAALPPHIGMPLHIHGSPFGCLAPSHFACCTVAGCLSACLPGVSHWQPHLDTDADPAATTGTAVAPLFMVDAACFPGMEGALVVPAPPRQLHGQQRVPDPRLLPAMPKTVGSRGRVPSELGAPQVPTDQGSICPVGVLLQPLLRAADSVQVHLAVPWPQLLQGLAACSTAVTGWCCRDSQCRCCCENSGAKGSNKGNGAQASERCQLPMRAAVSVSEPCSGDVSCGMLRPGLQQQPGWPCSEALGHSTSRAKQSHAGGLGQCAVSAPGYTEAATPCQVAAGAAAAASTQLQRGLCSERVGMQPTTTSCGLEPPAMPIRPQLRPLSPLERALLGLVLVRAGSSWATGILVSEGGIVITNAHLLPPSQHPAYALSAQQSPSSAEGARPLSSLRRPWPGWQPTGAPGVTTTRPSSVTDPSLAAPAAISGPLSGLALPASGPFSSTICSVRVVEGPGGGEVWLAARVLFVFRNHLDVAVLQLEGLERWRLRLYPVPLPRPAGSMQCCAVPGQQYSMQHHSSALWQQRQQQQQQQQHKSTGAGATILVGAQPGFDNAGGGKKASGENVNDGRQRTGPCPASQVSSAAQETASSSSQTSDQGLCGRQVLVLGHGLFGPSTSWPAAATHGNICKVVYASGRPTMLITTAAVHSGASGAAVVDQDTGALLGMVTSNARHGGGATLPRLNFCIAAQELHRLLDWAEGATLSGRRQHLDAGGGGAGLPSPPHPDNVSPGAWHGGMHAAALEALMALEEPDEQAERVWQLQDASGCDDFDMLVVKGRRSGHRRSNL